MGDISIRGKGKALKMKKGGETKKGMLLPIRRRKAKTDGASKRRAEEESMKELRYPTKKPSRPGRPTPKPVPMPRPMPGPNKDRPNFRPMPMPRPRRKIPEEIEKFLMDPRLATPAKKKDGGEMKGIAGMFGKGAMGVSAEKLKKAFEQAKKMKPTGRINTDDLKRALDSMKKAKKIDMNPARRKAETGSYTGKTRAEKLAQSIKDRPMRQKLRRKTRKMI